MPVGGQPHDVTFTPDGKRAFVSNRLDDNVSVVDVATHTRFRTIEVGTTARSARGPTGQYL